MKMVPFIARERERARAIHFAREWKCIHSTRHRKSAHFISRKRENYVSKNLRNNLIFKERKYYISKQGQHFTPRERHWAAIFISREEKRIHCILRKCLHCLLQWMHLQWMHFSQNAMNAMIAMNAFWEKAFECNKCLFSKCIHCMQWMRWMHFEKRHSLHSLHFWINAFTSRHKTECLSVLSRRKRHICGKGANKWCCNTLQHTAMHCNALIHTRRHRHKTTPFFRGEGTLSEKI